MANAIEVIAEVGDDIQAVQVTLHERPDVLMIDLAMPGIGGLEAVFAFRQTQPEADSLAGSWGLLPSDRRLESHAALGPTGTSPLDVATPRRAVIATHAT